ncbi:MAG: N5-glutamine methyltransferase family protein [Acidimicrobiia bacterium]
MFEAPSPSLSLPLRGRVGEGGGLGWGIPAHEARRLRAVAGRQAGFEELVDRRRAGEPLQYLEGTVQFGRLELLADRRALIPRPETELLWEMAVQALQGSLPLWGRVGDGQGSLPLWGRVGEGAVVVDLCTGSGNLALALKHAFPAAQVYATDISEEALSLAEANASRTGLEVELLRGDLFEPLPPELRGRVDLLVANPPYVSEAEFGDLPPEVRDHEPYQALVAGPRGDEVVRRVIEEAPGWLRADGLLFCEIAESLLPLPMGGGWGEGTLAIRPDLTGRPRVLVARRA